MIPQHSSHRPKGRQACWFLGSAVVLESKETLLSNPCPQRGSREIHLIKNDRRPWCCQQRNHGRNVLIEAKLLFHAPLPEIWKELKKIYPILIILDLGWSIRNLTTQQKRMWSTPSIPFLHFAYPNSSNDRTKLRSATQKSFIKVLLAVEISRQVSWQSAAALCKKKKQWSLHWLLPGTLVRSWSVKPVRQAFCPSFSNRKLRPGQWCSATRFRWVFTWPLANRRRWTGLQKAKAFAPVCNFLVAH